MMMSTAHTPSSLPSCLRSMRWVLVMAELSDYHAALW